MKRVHIPFMVSDPALYGAAGPRYDAERGGWYKEEKAPQRPPKGPKGGPAQTR